MGIVFFFTILLAVTLTNIWFLPRLKNTACDIRLPENELPSVSILVPARDEAENIAACLNSLLAQDYPNCEVLVLDDHSQDRTPEILASIARREPRLKVLLGQDLEEGWLGKPWACHQLAQAACGELFLFVDADTRHHPAMLREAVALLCREEAVFLSVLPQQEVVSPGERHIVPILYWSLMSFFPLPLAYRLPLPALAFAIGQFILVRRAAYFQTGGFKAVRANPADDLAFVRRIKAAGMRWRAADGRNRVACRMYAGSREAFNGISRSLFGAFNFRLLPFLFVWTWLAWATFQPPLRLLSAALSPQAASGFPVAAALAAGLAFVQWLIVTLYFRFPIQTALLYPLNILLAAAIALRSLVWSLRGQGYWKGRRMTRPQIRWW